MSNYASVSEGSANPGLRGVTMFSRKLALRDQKQGAANLRSLPLWLCTLPRVLRRTELLVGHREECLAARVTTGSAEVAGGVGAYHTIFGRAEGLGAGLRTEDHGLGVELDRN